MSHLLVTNDFPPKVGGIQVYLWELWRRLDPSSFTVLTAASDSDAPAFDAEQRARGLRIERVRSRVLLPTPGTVRSIRRLAVETGASLVVIDPALPLGVAGRSLGLPYAVILHGAEVTVPAHLPLARAVLGSVLRDARLVICAGQFPAAEAQQAAQGHLKQVVQVPPGVDTDRFLPLNSAERLKARESLGLRSDGPLVASVSRLVPRKGMDVLIEAAAALKASFPTLTVAIGGEGRDRSRLDRLARACGSPVRFLGHVADHSLPALLASSDVFVMACRNRWGGLEQEGFGIVFLEAAACGIPQVAGRSGGASEAVVHESTGLVIDDPADPAALAAALRRMLGDDALTSRMGDASRRRAEDEFGYDLLARRLAASLADVEG